MGCKHHKTHSDEQCICKKVRAIAKAQDEAVADHCCEVSCENSLRQLVSPSVAPSADTVPFMLSGGAKTTFSGLLPYFAWGIVKSNEGGSICQTPFVSPFFRVKKVKDDCCAVLELLCPIFCDEPGNEGVIESFTRTGACVTVDLHDFTDITCFHPVNAARDACTCNLLAIIIALIAGPLGIAGEQCSTTDNPLAQALQTTVLNALNLSASEQSPS